MSFAGSGPGKTAPKLFHDFLLFDPLKGQATANYLTDVTPPVGDGPQVGPVIGACRHDYSTKHAQSFTPPLDLRLNGGTKYKVALVCRRCRLHADIRTAFPHAVDPCPNSDYPLHHFQRMRGGDEASHDRIRYAWQCSAPACRAQLQITFKLPRLSEEDRDLLTNPDRLKGRYEAVVRDDPNREGVRQATPMEALSRLRRYLKDSLDPQRTKRELAANNKRFMEAFGVHGRDCEDLLQRLGFKYTEGQWILPNPPVLENRLHADASTPREMLEDVEIELLAWMYQLSSETGLINPSANEGWPSAERDIERTLAAQGYQRHAHARRGGPPNDLIPYFAGLGALPDFSDSLIEFAYDTQSACEPQLRPYYFECLQVIAEYRSTEQLQIKVVTLASQDLVSRRDLIAAYRLLNVTPTEAKYLESERILDRFHARLSDLGMHAQEEARQALYKIGLVRDSSLLINASRQTVETYQDALIWLGHGVTAETPDEALLAVVAMKTADSAANEEMAQKAISVIAKERKSDQLNNWLLTGRTDGHIMSVDEALRHLGIDQNLEAVDKTILPAIFDSARADRPGELTEKAIATIETAATGVTESTTHNPETWPVGLVSHGNTCYLNSLLQYYFSIKPLRDIILAYDEYKLDTTKNAEKTERVGQRKISMVEIKGGQRFAEDLKHLFERMIKEPGTAVKPEEDLVCRAFLEPKDYALLASSVINTRSQLPSEANGLENAINEDLTDDVLPPKKRHQSDASSTTLQASINGEKSEENIANKAELPLTPPTSPKEDQPTKTVTPTESAPPLPPRRFSTTKEEALSKAQSNARQQQDVTEVHDGIMFRLRSGMEPRGMDASEEQHDSLRDLFSIGLTETPVKDGIDQKPKQLLDSSIQLDVPTVATDVYSALDAVFDLQVYGDNASLETYKSIQSLPPLLQINIPRIGFDQDGHGGAYKSDACVRLEEELYLDRYADRLHAQILPKRKACWGWRKQLFALRKQQKMLSNTMVDLDGPATITEASKYLNNLGETNADLEEVGIDPVDVDPDLLSALTADADWQSGRLSELSGNIDNLTAKLKQQFDGMTKLKYHLATVFFHRGGHGHGHYWIYIRDFQSAIWRSYNDERVEEFTKLDEILEANTWNQGTPTYAVYVRSDLLDYVQPVYRAPEKLPTPVIPTEIPPPANEDVQMQNGEPLRPPQELPPSSSQGIDPKMSFEGEGGGPQNWDNESSHLHRFVALTPRSPQDVPERSLSPTKRRIEGAEHDVRPGSPAKSLKLIQFDSDGDPDASTSPELSVGLSPPSS